MSGNTPRIQPNAYHTVQWDRYAGTLHKDSPLPTKSQPYTNIQDLRLLGLYGMGKARHSILLWPKLWDWWVTGRHVIGDYAVVQEIAHQLQMHTLHMSASTVWPATWCKSSKGPRVALEGVYFLVPACPMAYFSSILPQSLDLTSWINFPNPKLLVINTVQEYLSNCPYHNSKQVNVRTAHCKLTLATKYSSKAGDCWAVTRQLTAIHGWQAFVCIHNIWYT